MPLLYYPGYRAQANGQECRVSRSENNVIRLYGVGQGTDLSLRVWFEPTTAWLISQGVSAAGAAMLALMLLGMGRRRRR